MMKEVSNVHCIMQLSFSHQRSEWFSTKFCARNFLYPCWIGHVCICHEVLLSLACGNISCNLNVWECLKSVFFSYKKSRRLLTVLSHALAQTKLEFWIVLKFLPRCENACGLTCFSSKQWLQYSIKGSSYIFAYTSYRKQIRSRPMIAACLHFS